MQNNREIRVFIRDFLYINYKIKGSVVLFVIKLITIDIIYDNTNINTII